MSDAASLKLGQIIEEGRDAQRDAIHVAVAPVVAGEDLKIGQRVGLNEAGEAVAHAPIGIVDPFLLKPVKKGQRFWLYLFPGSITSLRHEWTHPSFAPIYEREESERWLRAYALRIKPYKRDEPDAAFFDFIKELRAGEIRGYGTETWSINDIDDTDDLRLHAERFLAMKLPAWADFSFSCGC